MFNVRFDPNAPPGDNAGKVDPVAFAALQTKNAELETEVGKMRTAMEAQKQDKKDAESKAAKAKQDALDAVKTAEEKMADKLAAIEAKNAQLETEITTDRQKREAAEAKAALEESITTAIGDLSAPDGYDFDKAKLAKAIAGFRPGITIENYKERIADAAEVALMPKAAISGHKNTQSRADTKTAVKLDLKPGQRLSFSEAAELERQRQKVA